MPTQETYGAPKVLPVGPVGARVDTSTPAAAFGGGASADGLARSAEGVADSVTSLAERSRNQADQVAINNADMDVNGHETAAYASMLSAKGLNSGPAAQKSLEDFQKGSTKVLNGLQSDYQKTAVSHIIRARQFQMQRVAARHVSEQMDQFDDATTDASVKASQAKAIANYSDPVITSMEIDKQKAVLTDFAARKGLGAPGTPAADELINKAISTTHTGIVNQMTEDGHSEQAQQYVAANKDQLSPRDLETSRALVDRKLPQDIGTQVYRGIIADKAVSAGNKKFLVDGNPPLTADGSVDMEKISALVDKSTKATLTPEQKDRAVQVVSALANQDAEALRKANLGNTTAFYSKIATADDQGISKQDQYKIADKLAGKLPNGQVDQNDLAMKYNYINSPVKGSTVKDDPQTLISIHDGLNNGDIVTADPIAKAGADGLLSPRTVIGLTTMLQAGRSPAMHQQWKQIDASAEANFPIKDEKDEFLAILRAQSMEKKITDPIALQKLYKDNMETVPTGESSVFHWMGGGSSEYYKAQETIHQNQALVKAMGGGEAVFNLAKTMGGPANFAPGTPYSNAILYAIKNGKKPQQITSASIDWILKNRTPEQIK